MRTINVEELIERKHVDLKRVHNINQIIKRDCGYAGYWMYNEFATDDEYLDLAEWYAVAHYEKKEHDINE